MSWIRKTVFYGVTLFLMLPLIEFASFVIAQTVITDVRSGPDKIFNGVTVKDDAELDWVAYDGKPRPSSTYPPTVQQNDACIFVFGDSFSHSDEVSDEEAWANLLEEKVGCPVANYGVGGYGTDQAYLRMLRLLPDRSSAEDGQGNLVLFGVYQEMLRRNMAGLGSFIVALIVSLLCALTLRLHRIERG